MSDASFRSLTPTSLLPVRISALLLALQALALVVISSMLWSRALPQITQTDVLPAASVLDMLLFALLFFPLGVLGLAVALGLVLRWRHAWLPAMLLQAVILGVALYFYFALPRAAVTHNGIIYTILTSCIVVVLYLNTTDVRMAFRRVRPPVRSPAPPTANSDEKPDEFTT